MSTPRNIQTVYYFKKEVVQTNHAVHANSAILRCVDHMQLNDYGAMTAEVFDNDTGTLHAVVRRGQQEIVIVYKREVEGVKNHG